MKIFSKTKPKIAQSTIEFSVVIVVICAGILLMGPYVIRGINAHMKGWEDAVYDSMTDPLKQAERVPVIISPPGCVYQCGDGDCCSTSNPREDVVGSADYCPQDCGGFCTGDGYCCQDSNCLNLESAVQGDSNFCCKDCLLGCDGWCCADDNSFTEQTALTANKNPAVGECAEDCTADTPPSPTCVVDPNDTICCRESGQEETIRTDKKNCCPVFCPTSTSTEWCSKDCEDYCGCKDGCERIDCSQYSNYYTAGTGGTEACKCCEIWYMGERCCDFVQCEPTGGWECINRVKDPAGYYRVPSPEECAALGVCPMGTTPNCLRCRYDETCSMHDVSDMNPGDGHCTDSENIQNDPQECCSDYCGTSDQCSGSPDCWKYCGYWECCADCTIPPSPECSAHCPLSQICSKCTSQNCGEDDNWCTLNKCEQCRDPICVGCNCSKPATCSNEQRVSCCGDLYECVGLGETDCRANSNCQWIEAQNRCSISIY